MGTQGNMRTGLAFICLVAATVLSAGTIAGARGLAPAMTPGIHHTNVPVRHKTSAHKSKRGAVPAAPERRVTQYLGHKRREVIVTRHHTRHQKGTHHKVKHVASSRHAYPVNFFMTAAPEFDHSPLPTELSQRIHTQFTQGLAEGYPTRSLVRAGVVALFPMHGGIFWRREPVKYIIVHSTETGRPIGATRVIDAWSGLGRRHAGAQYVVDRDGTIYQAVDPDLATVHVNIFKTLPGINNDNSIGIEMVHAGSQNYPVEQRQSVIRLVTYLQERYKVAESNIVTHRYAQQGDHTDPVGFDWDGFLAQQKLFHMQALAMRMNQMNEEIAKLTPESGIKPAVYMQPHGKLPQLKSNNAASSLNEASSETQNATAAAQTENQGQPASMDVMQAASSKQFVKPTLRGPIEMDPHTASMLNSARSQTEAEPHSK
jgi:hypothetical protein